MIRWLGRLVVECSHCQQVEQLFTLNLLCMFVYRNLLHFSEIPVLDSERSNPCGIFVNNEICLSDITVYGFDYDYTLANYKVELHHMLYDLGTVALVDKYKVSGGLHKADIEVLKTTIY